MSVNETEQELHVMKVVHANLLTPKIIQLLLKPEHPMAYTSGDYVMLGFDSSELKPFSIANAPREDGLIECHIRKQDDGSWMQKLFAIKSGDTLVLQGPKPQLSLQPAHDPILFVAGGTGFAPLRALLIESLRQEIAVPITFYWGVRCAEDLYMHEWLIELTQREGHIEYIPVVSDNFENWQGETGMVHEAVLRHHPSLSHKMVYMCGPWAMIQTAREAFSEAGLEAHHLAY